MKIRSIRHKGLRRFVETDDASGLPVATVEKIRAMISFVEAMETPEELAALPSWRANRLTANRRGTWSLTVTRNWRITFRIEDDAAIVDLDFEDYH
jgi:toxin HigB-1